MINTTDAELERFYEKDIIEFLDKQQTLQGIETESLSLEKALNLNNVELANQILLKTIDKYNQLDNKDINKEIYFNKIQELVKMSTSYVNKHNKPSKLKDNLVLLTKSGQMTSGQIKNITVFDELRKKEKEKFKKQQKQEEELANNLTKELKKINKELFVSIRKKDLRQSFKLYKEFKKCFEKYPINRFEEKKELYNDLIAFYMRINQIRKELVQSNKNQSKITSVNIKKTYKLTAEELKDIIEKIKTLINNKEYKQANAKLLDLKHKISLISNNYETTKKSLEEIANSLAKKIEFSKRFQQNQKKEAKLNENETSA